MIPRDAEPISNDGPLKRIKIGSDAGKPADQRNVKEAAGDYSQAEANRVWRHVAHTAAGSTSPMPQAPETEVIDYSQLYDGMYGF